MDKASVGLIGLGSMGRSLALNMERNGFGCAVHDEPASRMDDIIAAASHKRIRVCRNLTGLVDRLEKPRRIMIVKEAGPGLDEIIENLKPLLNEEDLIMDLGNSHFLDTERRAREIGSEGFFFLGVGVSGGPEGVLQGPSIMVGGDPLGYRIIRPVLLSVAAQTDDGDPCVAFMGPRGAGHYVKMVHNAVEYGELQILAEAFDLLRRAAGLAPAEISEVMEGWNQGEGESHLLDVAARVLKARDPDTGRFIVDGIRDKADDEGTGRWACRDALQLGVPVPSLSAAVAARLLSSRDEERVAARARLERTRPRPVKDRDAWIKGVEESLLASRICTFAQGMSLLNAASRSYDYIFNLASITRIWQGGSLLKSRLLVKAHAVFRVDPQVPNLILHPSFSGLLMERISSWRATLTYAMQSGIPCPAMAASLAYFDALVSERLPADLIQAMRSYFGRHSVESEDRPGESRIDWPDAPGGQDAT